MLTIVLALHGGASADGAARVARLLRDRFGARIHAVAALEPTPMLDYGYGPVIMPDPAIDDALASALRAGAAGQLERCGLAGAELTLLRGPRVASIAEVATARKADLIVVGLGPHHILDRVLGGETSLHLAQQAATPLLAVPESMRALPRHAVAAIDFSPASLEAARLAARLLGAGDTLELVHVGLTAPAGDAAAGPLQASEALRRLADVSTQIEPPAGIRLLSQVITGDPPRALLDTVEHSAADLVAVGSHGYSAWRRMLLGSVSSKVLRLSQRAVLIFPARSVVTGELPAQHTAAAPPVPR